MKTYFFTQADVKLDTPVLLLKVIGAVLFVLIDSAVYPMSAFDRVLTIVSILLTLYETKHNRRKG